MVQDTLQLETSKAYSRVFRHVRLLVRKKRGKRIKLCISKLSSDTSKASAFRLGCWSLSAVAWRVIVALQLGAKTMANSIVRVEPEKDTATREFASGLLARQRAWGTSNTQLFVSLSWANMAYPG